MGEIHDEVEPKKLTIGREAPGNLDKQNDPYSYEVRIMTKTQLNSLSWRSSSAILHIEYSLQEIEQLFQGLLSLYLTSKTPVPEDLATDLDESEEARFDEFCEIYEPIIMQECKIAHKAELVCLMSSIQVESEINRFLHFNFEPDFISSTGDVSLLERLMAAVNTIKMPCSGKDSIFEAVRVLFCWRESYIHSSSTVPLLQTYNILQPCESVSLPAHLALLRVMLGAYMRVVRFLGQVSKKPTLSGNINEKHVRSLMNKPLQYCFDGNKWSIKSALDKKEQAEVAKIVSKVAFSGDNTQKMLLENCLATLPPRQEQILLMESGLESNRPCSRNQIIVQTGLSTKQFLQERSLALTSISTIKALF